MKKEKREISTEQRPPSAVTIITHNTNTANLTCETPTLLFKRKNIIPSSINFILPSTSTTKKVMGRGCTSLCFLVLLVAMVSVVFSVRVVKLDLAVTAVTVLLTSSPKSIPHISHIIQNTRKIGGREFWGRGRTISIRIGFSMSYGSFEGGRGGLMRGWRRMFGIGAGRWRGLDLLDIADPKEGVTGALRVDEED